MPLVRLALDLLSLECAMLPSVIDCHTHIDNHWLKYDAVPLKQRLRRCDATGVEAMVVSVYATRENLEEHLDHLCAVFDSFDVRLAVTLGYPPPSRAADLNAPPGHSTAALDAARRAARRPEIVGIGEVGMDYYWPQKEWMPEGEVLPLETEQDRVEAGLSEHPELERCLRAQADEFRRWIDLAQELDLPLVVHERDARNDTDRVITASGIDPNRVVYHCFTGTPDQALALADRGFWVSVPSSAVKREPFRSIAATAPLGRMLSETDAPYHSPMAGLWSRLYQEARAEVEDEGLTGKPAEDTKQRRRGRRFSAALDLDYPGLEFEVRSPDGELNLTPVAEYMRKSRCRNENESSFVRAVPRTVAESRGLDYVEVCETLAENARRVYSL